jgi:CubicO group peptidase (beta-lactamase class C family)
MKLSLILICLLCSQLVNAAPDEQAMGKGQNYPVGNIRTWTQPQNRIGSWSAPHKIEGLANARVDKSPTPIAIPKSSDPIEIKYTHNLNDLSVDQYFDRQKVTSLLIVKDGKILLEKYQYDRGQESRFLSYSMAKSITALLVGAALDKGLIKSLNDLAENYSSTLKGTSYGATSVRELLRMASGIEFREDYTGNDDLAKLSRSVLTGTPAITELFKSYSRKFQPGQRFNYSSLETMALGYMLRDVSGKTIAQLTKEWLWDPLGAEDEAYWLLSKDGMEGVYCCFAASARDWAKIGMLFAKAGTLNSQHIVSSSYMSDATSPDSLPSSLKTGLSSSFGGYGYQTWLLPGPGRQFYLRGVHGQSIYIQAESGLVMVHTAAFAQPSARIDSAPYDEMLNLWNGVVKSIGINK